MAMALVKPSPPPQAEATSTREPCKTFNKRRSPVRTRCRHRHDRMTLCDKIGTRRGAWSEKRRRSAVSPASSSPIRPRPRSAEPSLHVGEVCSEEARRRRKPRPHGAVRLFAVLFVALCALLVGFTGAGASAPITVRLEGNPQVGAFVDGALWVIEAHGGSASLVEIDAARARPTGRVAPLPAEAVPSPFGPGRMSFLGPGRIRPSMAVAGGDLFIPAGEEVLQIDPAAAREVRRIPFAARSVAAGPAGLWAIGGSKPLVDADGRVRLLWRLARIDPESGALEERTIGPGLGGLGPVDLAVGREPWIAFAGLPRYVVRYDPATGTTSGVGGSWQIYATGDALYATPRYGDVIEVHRAAGSRSIDMGLTENRLGVFWRDLAVGPAGSVWAANYRGPDRWGMLVQRALTGKGPVSRHIVGTDPVDVIATPRAVWVLNAADSTLTKVPAEARRPSEDGDAAVSLSAAQLRINQRIAQAAVRRINALTAMVDGLPQPEPRQGGAPGRVVLSAEQLLINQRISQAAVRRANELAGRLAGRLPTGAKPSPSGDSVALSARQLLIGQRIAQAAVRRANDLDERIPDIAFPPPSPVSAELDDVIGILGDGERAVMHVSTIRRRGTLGDGGQLAVGDSIPVVLPSTVPKSTDYGDESLIAAIGIISGGVMYGTYVSIIDQSELAP